MTVSCVIGASAGLGRAVAEALAARGNDVFLVASDARDLEALAQDLRLRHNVSTGFVAVDLARCDVAALRSSMLAALGPPDNLLLLAGAYSQEDTPGSPQAAPRPLIDVNFAAPVEIASMFLPDLKSRSGANIVLAGSVVTIRARRRAAAYGAAKAGLEFYADALRHALADTPCRVQFYRLGYIETMMTFGQNLRLPAKKPEWWAHRIVHGLGRDVHLRHPSFAWALAALVLPLVPWFIYRRLDL